MGVESLGQPWIHLEQDALSVDTRGLAGGLVAALSARCPGKPEPNEDGALIVPVGNGGAILAVADGLGGSQAGETAARIALMSLKDRVVAAARTNGLLRGAILDGIEEANHEIQARGVGAATTLAVVEINGKTARPYHVGDSLILVMGQRGRIKLQTVAHSPVGFGVESGLLDEHEALHHEDRHVVSNVIGARDMRVEIGSPLVLAPRDTLLLATDGLADNLTAAEIVARLRSGRLSEAATELFEEARRRMVEPTEGLPSKADDLTLIAFRPGGGDS